MCEIFQARFSNLFELTCCLIPDNVCVFAVSLTVAVFTYRCGCIVSFRYFNPCNTCYNITLFSVFQFSNKFPVIYDCCSFRFHQYKTGGVFVSFFVLQLSELFTSLFIVEITTVCLALIKNMLQLLFKSIKITFIDCILHSLTISFPSSFKKLSIVSTPYYIRGVLPLSDFTLKSANLSANIELFERYCSNR